jgi:hypothetical protein
MRLSDAIALGRTMIKATPGRVWHSDDTGCAWGMALKAAGLLEKYYDHPPVIGTLSVDIPLPWQWVKKSLCAPCPCKYASSVAGVIVHLFDWHVFEKKDWTLDQLIDWVRSVEPAEEQPQENSGQTKEELTTIKV